MFFESVPVRRPLFTSPLAGEVGSRSEPGEGGPPTLPLGRHASQPQDDPDSRRTYQLDPDFLEHIRRERAAETARQLSLPWDD